MVSARGACVFRSKSIIICMDVFGSGQESPAAEARSRTCDTVPVLTPTAAATCARVSAKP